MTSRRKPEVSDTAGAMRCSSADEDAERDFALRFCDEKGISDLIGNDAQERRCFYSNTLKKMTATIGEKNDG